MNMTKGILFAGVIVLACLAWFLTKDGKSLPHSHGATESDTKKSNDAKEATGNRAHGVAVQTVLQIDPRARSLATSTAPAIAVKPASSQMLEFRAKQNYSKLLASLKAGEQSAESLWLQAKILDECSDHVPREGEPKVFKKRTPEENKAWFLTKLLANDPLRAKREAAYEILAHDYCGTLRETKLSIEDRMVLYQKALDAGDERASLALDRHKRQLAQERAAKGAQPCPADDLSDEQLDKYKRLLAAKDFEVIDELDWRLSGWIEAGLLTLDASGRPVDSNAMRNAWRLVACDLGKDCGPNSRELADACAGSGECDAANLQDHLMFYELSPGRAQRAQQYREIILNMIRTGDFSQLRIDRNTVVKPPKAQ